jgi:hypothetical protein
MEEVSQQNEDERWQQAREPIGATTDNLLSYYSGIRPQNNATGTMGGDRPD